MTSTLQPKRVPMQVLVLSMSRTGTVSLFTALNMLGYKTLHGTVYNEEDKKHARWERAIDAKYYGIGKEFTLAQWDDLLSEYSAVTDVPCSMFADELVAMYPDAKVILTERDEMKWEASARELIVAMYMWPAQILRFVVEPLKGDPSKGSEASRPAMSMTKLFFAHFHATNRVEFEANLLTTYRAHNAHIRELMADQPHRFLEYKLGSGWDPLCKFLGVKAPENLPFPHLNEQAEFQKWMLEQQMKHMNKVLVPLKASIVPVMVVAVAACSWYFMRFS